MIYKIVLTLTGICISTVRGDCVLSETLPDPESGCCGYDISEDPLNTSGNAGIDEFPWIALIENTNGIFFCTGVLISSRYVLTGAQCLYGNPYGVRLGDFNKTNPGPDCVVANGKKYCNDGAITIRIETAIPHPMYSRFYYSVHDIAILKLAQPVSYTNFIRPICLPTSDITLSPPADLRFTNAGWGSKPSNPDEYNVAKHYVVLPYKTLQECQLAYKKYTIGEGHICAGGEAGLSSCKGDGGGPLMHQEGGRYDLVGIVSFGPRHCGREGVPSVYTKVHHYLPWIKSVIN